MTAFWQRRQVERGLAYRVPGKEGPAAQGQVGHELDGQTCAAVPSHHFGVAVGSGHMQD